MPRKDPEAKRQYMREWRAKNPDKVKANSDRAAPTQRAYRLAHLPQYASYQRAQRQRNPRDALVCQARSRAKRDSLQCDIAVDTIDWPTHCPVFGIELDYTRTPAGDRKIRTNSPTLDRRVNDLGYVVGNVFVISHRANRIKSDATAAELEAVLAYVRS